MRAHRNYLFINLLLQQLSTASKTNVLDHWYVFFFFYPLDVELQPVRSNNNSIDSRFIYIWKVVHIQKTKLPMVITNQASLTFYSSYSCEEGWFLWWWWWLIWHLVPLESCWFQTTVEPPLMSNSPQWPLLYSGYIPNRDLQSCHTDQNFPFIPKSQTFIAITISVKSFNCITSHYDVQASS